MKKRRITLFHVALSLILVIILVMAGLLVFMKPGHRKPVKKIFPADTVTAEPKTVFRNDGQLTFRKGATGQDIATIDVEIADDEPERVQGLMYRDSMAENQGMLFLFPREEPMAFWMKNTRISLDIIYLDSERKIVDIVEDTKPFSLEQLPSKAPAQFVVEVNAGFTVKHGIKVGDYINF